MKKLSIIIVTYHSERDIFECVQSVLTHLDLPKEHLELIVVDNGSAAPEAMFSRLRQLWGEDIICICNDYNGGYGQGNNVGIRRSTAPVSMVMNPDVRLVRPIFSRALKHFDDCRDLAILGMSQYYPSGRRSRNSIGVTWMMNGYLRTLIHVLANRIDWYWSRYMYAQGSCFFLRKSSFEEVGMFDESNFMYGEEEDLHYRIRQRFGNASLIFDRRLGYVHLSENRTPSFDYEKKLIDANVSLYQKKGVDSSLIVKHFLQNARLQLLFYYIKSPQSGYCCILRQIIGYLNSKL